MDELIGRLIPIGHRRYRVFEVIGTWGDNNEYGVYRCRRMPLRLEYPFVSIMVLPRTSQNQEFWLKTENQINEFHDYFGYLPRNLFLYEKTGITRLLNVQSRVTILPFQNVKSIRSLLVNDQANGMPMNVVAFLVKECTRGLVDLHHFRISHGKISARALFYNPADRSGIKLAYGPTYHVAGLNLVPEPDFKKMSEIWGREEPDETLGHGGLPTATVHDEYDHDEDPELRLRMKQDIWLIGVMSLELAYGSIGVKDDEQFLKVIRYIVTNTGLPKSWAQLRMKTTKNWRMRTVLHHPRLTTDYVNFLHCCFSLSMAERPSALTLLNHNFLIKRCLYYGRVP